MSDGPVYCPGDGAELQFHFQGLFFHCAKCGLRWNGQFPVGDNFKRALAYPKFCREADKAKPACSGKGYCPLDPACNE